MVVTDIGRFPRKMRLHRSGRGKLARLVGFTVMIAIALAATAVPALAQGSRAAERAASEAQGVVEDVDLVLKETQNVRQDTDQTEVQAEEATVQTEEQDKVKDEATGKKGTGRAANTMPKTGGFITISDTALLGLGTVTLLAGVVRLRRSFG